MNYELWTVKNKAKQTQFYPERIQSYGGSTPKSTFENLWLDYFLFFKYFTSQIIGESYFYYQFLIIADNFVGYVKNQPVINGYQGGKPVLF